MAATGVDREKRNIPGSSFDGLEHSSRRLIADEINRNVGAPTELSSQIDRYAMQRPAGRIPFCQHGVSKVDADAQFTGWREIVFYCRSDNHLIVPSQANHNE